MVKMHYIGLWLSSQVTDEINVQNSAQLLGGRLLLLEVNTISIWVHIIMWLDLRKQVLFACKILSEAKVDKNVQMADAISEHKFLKGHAPQTP